MQTPQTPDHQSDRDVISDRVVILEPFFLSPSIRRWVFGAIAAAGLLATVKGTCGRETKTMSESPDLSAPATSADFAPALPAAATEPEQSIGQDEISQERKIIYWGVEPGRSIFNFNSRGTEEAKGHCMNGGKEVIATWRDTGNGSRVMDIKDDEGRTPEDPGYTDPCKGEGLRIMLPY